MASIESTGPMVNIEPESYGKFKFLCHYLRAHIVFLDREFYGVHIREREIKEEKDDSMLIIRKKRLRACYELLALTLLEVRCAYDELESSIYGLYVIENTYVGQAYMECKKKYPVILHRIRTPIIITFVNFPKLNSDLCSKKRTSPSEDKFNDADNN